MHDIKIKYTWEPESQNYQQELGTLHRRIQKQDFFSAKSVTVPRLWKFLINICDMLF